MLLLKVFVGHHLSGTAFFFFAKTYERSQSISIRNCFAPARDSRSRDPLPLRRTTNSARARDRGEGSRLRKNPSIPSSGIFHSLPNITIFGHADRECSRSSGHDPVTKWQRKISLQYTYYTPAKLSVLSVYNFD